MDYRHHFFAGQRIARTTVTDGANPFVYCGYDPINRTDADGGGGAGPGKTIERQILWHVQIQKPDMSGPTLWDAIVRLFTGSSSSSSSSDESAEKEGEPEGKKKPKAKKSAKGKNGTEVAQAEKVFGEIGEGIRKLVGKGKNVSIGPLHFNFSLANTGPKGPDLQFGGVSDHIQQQHDDLLDRNHFRSLGISDPQALSIKATFDTVLNRNSFEKLDKSLQLTGTGTSSEPVPDYSIPTVFYFWPGDYQGGAE